MWCFQLFSPFPASSGACHGGVMGSYSLLMSTGVHLSSQQEQPWMQQPPWGERGRVVDHPSGAGVRGFQPSSAWPFLCAEWRGDGHPLCLGLWAYQPAWSMVLMPTGSSPDFQTDCRGASELPALWSGDLSLSTWRSWLVVALLGSEKKTELLIFFLFILPHFSPPHV